MNSELTDAVALLAATEDSERTTRGSWDAADDRQWHRWNAQYLDWLLSSENGAVAARTTNNHHTWFAVETIALSLTVSNNGTIPRE